MARNIFIVNATQMVVSSSSVIEPEPEVTGNEGE